MEWNCFMELEWGENDFSSKLVQKWYGHGTPNIKTSIGGSGTNVVEIIRSWNDPGIPDSYHIPWDDIYHILCDIPCNIYYIKTMQIYYPHLVLFLNAVELAIQFFLPRVASTRYLLY